MADHPTLLVLGAGRHQAPLIERAEQRGVATVALDYFENSPGKRIATHTVLADALDHDRVLAAAREHRIDGITTVGTDQPVLVMARVAAELGLPCHVTPEGALRSTNKAAMRPALVEAGVPMPAAVTLRPDDDVDALELDAYPYVLKAADSQGQRGMSVVRERPDLERGIAAARAASRSATVIIEEFSEGPELTINAWMDEGEPLALVVLDRITFNPPPAVGICLQHVFPSVFLDREVELAEVARAVARGYGMRRGPLYIQAIAGASGFRVLEAAARVGGGHEAQLLPRLDGLELLDRTIELALGRPEAPYVPRRLAPSGLVNFVVAKPGTLTELAPIDRLATAGMVDEGAWYIDRGYEQRPIVDSMGRVGYFIVTAPTRAESLERAAAAYAEVRALDGSGSNLVFWPERSVLNEPGSAAGAAPAPS